MDRRVLLVLGGLAAASIGAAVVTTPDDTATAPPAGAGLAFPGLAARLGDAAVIEVRRGDQVLEVRRQGEAWVLPARAGHPVRAERVREVLVGLTELRLTEPRTADPAMLDRLGLEDPARPGATSALLRVLDARGQPLAELVVGRRRMRVQGNVAEQVQVRRPAESQAWLAEGRLPVDADPNLWVDRDIVNLPRERVRAVRVERAGEPPLALRRGRELEAPLELAGPAEAPGELDEISLDEVARAFEFLTFTEVRAAADAPGEALATARFELTDNLAVTVESRREGESLWVRLAAEGDAEAATLNARWSPWAYQVGQWKERAFAPRIADLLKQPR